MSFTTQINAHYKVVGSEDLSAAHKKLLKAAIEHPNNGTIHLDNDSVRGRKDWVLAQDLRKMGYFILVKTDKLQFATGRKIVLTAVYTVNQDKIKGITL